MSGIIVLSFSRFSAFLVHRNIWQSMARYKTEGVRQVRGPGHYVDKNFARLQCLL